MSTPVTPPTKAALFKATIGTVIAAAILLVLVVLPAEYGIDPTGFGNATGLTAMAEPPARTIALADVVGGNQALREVTIPDTGEPTPLPNPAVFQHEPNPPETRTVTITIPPEGETEVKLVMDEGKVAVFSWTLDQGTIYVDHHGHDASFGPDFFVRYVEEDESSGGNGSLTAPFYGEHGWYWLNYNEFEVNITLTVTGYFNEIKDYGLF